MNTVIKASLLALAVCAAQTQAQASIVRLDGNGFDVIYDTSQTGLFGTPTLSGNTIIFTPSSLSVDSASTPISPLEWQTAGSQVSFQVVADAGNHLQTASLVESGNYQLVGAQAGAYVTAQGQINSLSDPSKSVSGSATRSGVGYCVQGTCPVLSGSWNISANQSLYGVDGAQFLLKDALWAKGLNESNAKADLNYLAVTVTAVPEPATYAMLLAGLGMLGFIKRRRKV